MKKWISLPRVEGHTSHQAHADFPQHTYEREMGKEGFFGPSVHLHHQHPPTAWNEIQGPLLPRAFDTTKITNESETPWGAKTLLSNSATQIRFWKSNKSMNHLVRNADGDDLLFLHSGSANLYCDFGHLPLLEGDYVVIPRGAMWRIEHDNPVQILMIEATHDAFQLPEKGLVGSHAIFDQAMLETPKINDKFKSQYSEEPWSVKVKKNNTVSVISYLFNPLDAVGWHGDLFLVKINWRDIRPLMSHRYHLPPSAHTTFVANRFVVCTFVPRPFESDPGALKVPFFHNNDDYDEVLFYHQGEFFSRDNIHPGMITLHPSGITHGPHPKALNNAFDQPIPATNEVAIMIDTRDPLNVDDAAVEVEWSDYVNSWKVSTS